MQMVMLIDQANAIAEALKKNVVFELQLESKFPDANLEEAFREELTSEAGFGEYGKVESTTNFI